MMTRQSIRCFAIFFKILIFIFIAGLEDKLNAASSSKDKTQAEVLVLHSFSSGSRWDSCFADGISERFRNSDFPNARIRHEYLDPREGFTNTYMDRFAEQLRNLYSSGSPPRVIITCGENAYSFFTTRRRELFPGVPLVFCGLNDFNKDVITEIDRPFTGLVERGHIIDTVREAYRIHPGTEELYVICDNKLPASRAILKEAVKQLAPMRSTLKIHYWFDQSFETLISNAANIGRDGIILLLTYNQDCNGRSLPDDYVLKKLQEATTAPIYSIFRNYSGKGIVGGKFMDASASGRLAAELAIRILSGGDAKDIPIIDPAPALFVFDWRELERFSVSSALLPPDSVIINQPENASKYMRWLPVAALLILVQSGFIIALLFISRRQNRLRRELSASERQWRSLTENMPDIIFRIDRQGHYRYINGAVERTFKIKAEDLIGKTARQLKLPESERTQENNEVLSVFRDGKMRTRVDEQRTSNGMLIMESRFVPEHDDGGHIVNVLGISRDITEQKLASRELSLRQFILENSHVGILILRHDGSIYFSNQAAELLLDYSHEQLDDKMFGELNWQSGKIDISKLMANLRQEKFLLNETSYCSPAGLTVPVELIFNFMKVGGDEFICVFINDVTARREHEEELRQARDMAQQSDQLKSAFLANMSHEVRTPLNGILGFAELLRHSDPSAEDARKYTEIIYESGNTLLKIIDDILDISKIESGQIKVVKNSFSLNLLLRDLYNFFLHQPGYSQDKVKLVYSPDESGNEHIIYSDETRLRQILVNLIGNAMKFTHEGVVEFGINTINGQNTIYVKDTGIGIPLEKQQIIFEPFRQGEDSISRTYGGTGLGLAIVESYAGLLDMQIYLESALGEGSTFFLKLPADIYRDELNGQPAREDASGKDYNWTGRTILVVEDDRISFLFLNKLLSMTGAGIIHAGDGGQAVKLCRENPEIDIVLMDVRLPDVSGWEATRQIKESKPALPVVIETAHALSGDKNEELLSSCDGFLTKPIKKEELLTVINDIFYSRASGVTVDDDL
jgi:PAS domain S-box-containing protein